MRDAACPLSARRGGGGGAPRPNRTHVPPTTAVQVWATLKESELPAHLDAIEIRRVPEEAAEKIGRSARAVQLLTGFKQALPIPPPPPPILVLSGHAASLTPY